MAKNINRRIAAEISWARTHDRAARTSPARAAFLQRFENEVDPDGILPPEERRQRAEHAKRAYMLQLARRSAAVRKGAGRLLYSLRVTEVHGPDSRPVGHPGEDGKEPGS